MAISTKNPGAFHIAQYASVAEFLERYEPSMAKLTWSGGGSQMLPAAVTNKDLEARVFITNQLLDDGADPSVMGSNRTNVLHQLFYAREHDFVAEAPMLRRLLEGGADINAQSPKWGCPLLVLLDNLNAFDRHLGPFYDVIFSWPGIDWDMPVSFKNESKRRVLRDHAFAKERTRPEFVRRMREYEANGPSPWPPATAEGS